jgi:PREDICTED: titin-like
MKRNVSKSLLFICLGLIAAIVFTSAVMVVRRPGPPGKPEVVNVQMDRCTVKYLAPRDDGGSPITEYIIECKHTSAENWYRVTKDRITGLEYTVTNLVEGSEVQFRVRAVNAEGPSEPSKESGIIKIEDPF